MIWIQFAVCAVIIILLSTQLTRYGDAIAEKTGLGRAWVGAILIAGVTSLPELASGISAVNLLKQPNLAAGSILGSCLFNLALIAVMDLAYQPGLILTEVEDSHLLSGGLGIILFSAVTLAVLLGPDVNGFGVLGISIFSIIILIAYGLGARMIARLEQRRFAEVLENKARQNNYENISSRKSYSIFIMAAAGIIIAGIWLSYIGNQLSLITGLSQSFVGNFFLAMSTSLPEVAASLAAVRMGAIDIAIGNVMGSNLFNILLLGIFDITDGKDNFWGTLTTGTSYAAVLAMLMTSIVVVSIVYRASPKFLRRISWDGISLIIVYIGAMVLLYFH